MVAAVPLCGIQEQMEVIGHQHPADQQEFHLLPQMRLKAASTNSETGSITLATKAAFSKDQTRRTTYAVKVRHAWWVRYAQAAEAPGLLPRTGS